MYPTILKNLLRNVINICLPGPPWWIIGRSHQLTLRREILGGEGGKYLEGKERNTWRRRREILGGQGGENSFSTRRKEAISRPVRGPSLTVLVYKHISMYILIYTLMCVFVHLYMIYIYWATLCRSKCTPLCSWVSQYQRMMISVSHFNLFTNLDHCGLYIAGLLEAPSYILKGLCCCPREEERNWFQDISGWVCYLRRKTMNWYQFYINWGQSVITGKRIYTKAKICQFFDLRKNIELLTIHLK